MEKSCGIDPIKKEHIVEIKTHLPNLMVQAAKECQCFAITMGFDIALKRIRNIARQAIKIKDKEILKELELLGIVSNNEN